MVSKSQDYCAGAFGSSGTMSPTSTYCPPVVWWQWTASGVDAGFELGHCFRQNTKLIIMLDEPGKFGGQHAV